MSRIFKTGGPGGLSANIPPHSDYVNHYALLANAAQDVEWPGWAEFCNIQGEDVFYVRADGSAAAVPAGAVADGTGSARSPAQRRRNPGEAKFSIVSGVVQTVTVEFWSAQA